MLSIGKIAAGPRAARYYTEQVAHGGDDYYSGEGEEPGTWTGAGAASLGLAGEVDDERFADLLAGAGLRKPPREGAIAGFDLTFRAPKSVGVLWGVCSPEVTAQLRAGHDQAVAQALGYLEREACRARRGKGGAVQVSGRGFVAAAFLHRASRAGDPLLHTHVVVGNLTQGPDGRWTALDGRYLYRQAKTAGFLYQAVLRRELTERLGLQWTPVENGVADVVGVPREVIEHFSKRRAEILEHQAEHGSRSARSAQVAALETRRAKEKVAVDRLRELWRARAAEHGLDERAIARLPEAPDRGVVPARLVGLERVTEGESTFGRAELLQHLAAAQPRGATIAELERLADRTLTDPETVALKEGRAPAGLTEVRFTTREMLRVERELIDGALARRRERAGTANRRAIRDALQDRSLSAEQRRVVVELCGRGAGVAVVRAPAGTGKTFVLDAAREAWQQSGLTVIGCALSARAALELQEQAGIDAVTIAKLKQHVADSAQLPYRGVLVVDEAGMVGTRDLAHLAHSARMFDTKLVLVGDDRQLPEIQAGGAFRALADRLGASELREVRRQREPWDRAALDALRDGDVERWARAYRDHGRITIARRAADARAALVNDWHRAEGDKLMIAARRDDVRDLNDRARQLLQANGELGPDQLQATGRGFAVGDRVVGRRNDRSLGIVNGQRATIHAIDTERRSVELELDDGKRITVNSGYLDAGHLDHGYAITAHRAQGATVDRTFVLGSDELYREWGYTALSRHRDEARFYITRADLDLDRDSAPTPDPQITAIERLLTRSHAKDLALDQLRDTDRAELDREREALRERFAEDPPPSPATLLDEEVDRAAAALDNAHERRSMLQQSRDALPWHRRRERAELNGLLERNAQEIEQRTERHHRARLEHTAATDAELSWLQIHGSDAERLLAVDHELRARQHIDARVTGALDQLHNGPAPLERGIEPPTRDLGRDLGMDL